MEGFSQSGWQDSNLRPPGPKPGAMTGLRYTPNITYLKLRTFRKSTRTYFNSNFQAESVGFEPTRRFPADSLANCSVNHSGNSPFRLLLSTPKNEDANVAFHF